MRVHLDTTSSTHLHFKYMDLLFCIPSRTSSNILCLFRDIELSIYYSLLFALIRDFFILIYSSQNNK